MKVLVLMGGESAERAVSVASGYGVARALEERGHEVLLLDTREGFFPISGEPPPIEIEANAPALGHDILFRLTSPELAGIDVAFIALHGGAGEDGTLQALLEAAGFAYTGSGVLASALAMHKGVSKRLFREEGIPTPPWATIRGDLPTKPEAADEAVAGMGGYPVVVKPVDQGSTVGISIVGSPGELPAALREAGLYSPEILLESYVPGREITVGILGETALPVVEIEPKGEFYDFASKYAKGGSSYRVPADLSPDTAAKAQALALRVFRLLGAEGFGRVDFRLSPREELSCLELNTVPGMTSTSLVPMAARAAGVSFGELVETIARLGLERGSKRDALETAGGNRAQNQEK